MREAPLIIADHQLFQMVTLYLELRSVHGLALFDISSGTGSFLLMAWSAIDQFTLDLHLVVGQVARDIGVVGVVMVVSLLLASWTLSGCNRSSHAAARSLSLPTSCLGVLDVLRAEALPSRIWLALRSGVVLPLWPVAEVLLQLRLIVERNLVDVVETGS